MLLEQGERLVEPVQAEQMGKQNVEFCRFQVFSGNPGRAGSVFPWDQPVSAVSVALLPHHGLGSGLPRAASPGLPQGQGGESYKNKNWGIFAKLEMVRTKKALFYSSGSEVWFFLLPLLRRADAKEHRGCNPRTEGHRVPFSRGENLPVPRPLRADSPPAHMHHMPNLYLM